MEDVRAVLLAGGEGRRMGALGRGRPKPLIPFGAKSRLIDFSLANARASGLAEVLLLSQHEEKLLMDELHRTWNRGKGFRVHFGPYDRAYRLAGDRTLPGPLPPSGLPPERGTADALIRKAPWVFDPRCRDVMVLHADHVYRLHYEGIIRQHRETGAALTVSYQRIDRRFVHLFGVVELTGAGVLTDLQEKPPQPTSDLIFAAFCVFDAAALRRHLEILDGTSWRHDISRDVIPAMLRAGEKICGYEVRGYWEDIGTVERYHLAHRKLLGDDPSLTLAELPCTLLAGDGCRYVAHGDGIRSSIVPVGLQNDGVVEDSTVFPGSRIGTGALVRDSVLLPGAQVEAGSRVDSAVVLENGEIQPCAPAGRTEA